MHRRKVRLSESAVKLQSYVRGFHAHKPYRQVNRSLQDTIDALWTKFTGSFIESSLRETRGGCSWTIYPGELKQPMTIERNLCQEMDVEYSGDPGLQENRL